MKIQTIILFVSILLFFSGCGAAVHKGNVYVDALNGDDKNSGNSSEDPIRTLNKISDSHLQPGDTIFLRSGSVWYEELLFPSSGNKNKPVVITSYGTGEKPAIDGQKIRKNNIYIYNKKYVEIHNLHLSNSIGSGGIRIAYGTGIKVIGCDFEVTGHGGIFIENSSNCTLSGNRITSPEEVRNAQTDGIYSQRNNNIIIEKNIIILRNNQQEQHIDGIQSYLDKNMIISSNYIFQDNSKSNSQGIYTTNAQGKHVYFNNIVYCPNTLASVIGFRNLDRGYGSLELYNNTLKSRGSNNLYVSETDNVSARNNIFVTSSPAYIINISSRIENPVNSFNHNLYFRAGNGNIVNYPPGGGGKTFEQWQQDGFDLNSISADPKLDNNLYITSASPAIDAGEDLYSFETDFSGTKRIKGKSTDIGAFEFNKE